MAGNVPIAKSLSSIYPADALPSQQKRWNDLLSSFASQYGHPATFVSRSPGRVNIIGEHIDYSLYEVLPMAITADALLAVHATPSSSSNFEITVANAQPDKFPPRTFSIGLNDDVEIDAKVHEWTNYFKSGLKGALELLRKKAKTGGKEFKPQNIEVLMDGNVPAGGGLSSSAAFVSASALAVMYANGVEEVDKTELTELAIVSERSVGVNSGGMDQSASVLSLKGSALYVSFKPSLTARHIYFPETDPELSFVIAQSFVTSNKYVTGPVCYNLRVVECSLAAAYLHAVASKSHSLPALEKDSGPLGISLRGFHDSYFHDSKISFEEQLEKLIGITKDVLTKEEGYTREEIAEVLGLSVDALNERYTSIFPVRADRFKLRQRALHVFSEASRVLSFLSILENTPVSEAKSINQKLGNLMNETQDSCRDVYECSCPEIDDLCAIARRAGAYGSRLTGAGWGGCSVHLVPSDKVEAVKAAWEKEYYSKMDLNEEQKEAAVVVSKPGSGSAVFIVEGGKL